MRDPANVANDHGFAQMQGFGDFYLEPFALRELRYEEGTGDAGVEELVRGWESGDQEQEQEQKGEEGGFGGLAGLQRNSEERMNVCVCVCVWFFPTHLTKTMSRQTL